MRYMHRLDKVKQKAIRSLFSTANVYADLAEYVGENLAVDSAVVDDLNHISHFSFSISAIFLADASFAL